MDERITDTKRLWFEWDETGRVHMDSLDPKTGSQLSLYSALQAWKLMTDLIVSSYELQMGDPVVSEKSQIWAQQLAERMKVAREIVFPGDTMKPTDVRIRRTWDK